MQWQLDMGMFWVAGVANLILVFTRISAVTSVMPGVGTQSIPVRVRLAVAIALTAIVFPGIGIGRDTGDLPIFLVMLGKEAVVGLAIGIGLRLIFMGLQTAGSIAAQSTSLSQILGSTGTEPMPAIGQVLIVGGVAAAMAMGLHVHIAKMLVLSYELVPLGSVPSAPELAEWGLSRTARAFGLALSLAAPFVIVSVLYNLMLGVINRAMPQLMVAFVGAPLITLGGLFLLFLSAPHILQVWTDTLFGFTPGISP